MINLFVKEAKKPNESIYFNINISELFGIIFSRVSKEYLLKWPISLSNFEYKYWQAGVNKIILPFEFRILYSLNKISLSFCRCSRTSAKIIRSNFLETFK